MRAVSRGFHSGNLSAKVRPGLNGLVLQPELRNVAKTFGILQEARHEADYNLARSLTRQEINDLIDVADRAFRDWQTVRGTLQADVFLTALLAQKHMQV